MNYPLPPEKGATKAGYMNRCKRGNNSKGEAVEPMPVQRKLYYQKLFLSTSFVRKPPKHLFLYTGSDNSQVVAAFLNKKWIDNTPLGSSMKRQSKSCRILPR